ncbi:hypothetical protein A1Q_5065 [Vibrio campbellii HY01]|nr:hypothetical protein A1Q_5065 [Vibrio campbellii HY01]
MGRNRSNAKTKKASNLDAFVLSIQRLKCDADVTHGFFA